MNFAGVSCHSRRTGNRPRMLNQGQGLLQGVRDAFLRRLGRKDVLLVSGTINYLRETHLTLEHVAIPAPSSCATAAPPVAATAALPAHWRCWRWSAPPWRFRGRSSRWATPAEEAEEESGGRGRRGKIVITRPVKEKRERAVK